MLKSAIRPVLLALTLATASLPAFAQEAREAQMIGFHQLCERGDRAACVKFGMMLEQNKDRHEQWRRSHPDFFFFER